VLFVESGDGGSVGLITSRSQLDALMAALNRRAPREGALHAVRRTHAAGGGWRLGTAGSGRAGARAHAEPGGHASLSACADTARAAHAATARPGLPQALHKRYPDLCRCLRAPPHPLDVAAIPRDQRLWALRRRRRQPHWLTAAAAVLPARGTLAALQQQQQHERGSGGKAAAAAANGDAKGAAAAAGGSGEPPSTEELKVCGCDWGVLLARVPRSAVHAASAPPCTPCSPQPHSTRQHTTARPTLHPPTRPPLRPRLWQRP
jgi:hypothetical protein